MTTYSTIDRTRRDNITVEVYGEARGNPGLAGIGAVVKDRRGRTLAHISRYLGACTPARAEYEALVAGLSAASSRQATGLVLTTSHEAPWRQLTGRTAARSPETADLFVEARRLMAELGDATLEFVPESEVETAERLAAVAIDSRGRRTAIDYQPATGIDSTGSE